MWKTCCVVSWQSGPPERLKTETTPLRTNAQHKHIRRGSNVISRFVFIVTLNWLLLPEYQCAWISYYKLVSWWQRNWWWKFLFSVIVSICEWALWGAMDTGACCVAPSAPSRSDDQIVPAHPGDCWNPHQNNHSQPFVDAWLLQMQVSQNWNETRKTSCNITEKLKGQRWF